VYNGRGLKIERMKTAKMARGTELIRYYYYYCYYYSYIPAGT